MDPHELARLVRVRVRIRVRVRVGVRVRVRVRWIHISSPICRGVVGARGGGARYLLHGSVSARKQCAVRRWCGGGAELMRRCGGDAAEIRRRCGGDAEVWQG